MRKKPINEEPIVVPQQEDRMLDVNATMQGTLRFDDPVNLRISGKFEGTLDTKGKLIIGNKAVIKANISGEDIQISGTVTGNIKASVRLKLTSSAILDGDLETPRLQIEDGAIMMGQVRMESKNSSLSGVNLMNIGQLADYLEVDTRKVSDWANSGMLPGIAEGGEWMFEKNKVDQWVAQGKMK
ncbi:MAG: polymer-forming cytoskeletal protein [Candidatus Omnitrophica bacterium]|nr:polymer-forming cytoskeletal protein [Candidatus Omnitrophota bacterium]